MICVLERVLSTLRSALHVRATTLLFPLLESKSRIKDLLNENNKQNKNKIKNSLGKFWTILRVRLNYLGEERNVLRLSTKPAEITRKRPFFWPAERLPFISRFPPKINLGDLNFWREARHAHRRVRVMQLRMSWRDWEKYSWCLRD